MVKLIIASVLSAALALGSEHLADHIDKGNVKPSEAIPGQDSIQIDLPTRSIPMPAVDATDAN